jgi:hypothetical protein
MVGVTWRLQPLLSGRDVIGAEKQSNKRVICFACLAATMLAAKAKTEKDQEQ